MAGMMVAMMTAALFVGGHHMIRGQARTHEHTMTADTTHADHHRSCPMHPETSTSKDSTSHEPGAHDHATHEHTNSGDNRE